MPEPLTEAGLPADPLELLHRWLDEAEATGMIDPNAMTIATSGADGRPSARTVLLRGADAEGLRFYTNRESLKGRQLGENPRAQALFFWRELRRQIFVHGAVEFTTEAESDAYFATRPPGSRAGAWASQQGRPLASREALIAEVAAVEERFADADEIPRPPHWGGYLLRPAAIEFWQAGEYRLHDRFVYAREGDGWRVERLQP